MVWFGFYSLQTFEVGITVTLIFRDEKTDTKSLNKLPKVIQLVRGRAKI